MSQQEIKLKRKYIYGLLKKIAEIYDYDYKTLKFNYLQLTRTEKKVYNYQILKIVEDFEKKKSEGEQIYKESIKNLAAK